MSSAGVGIKTRGIAKRRTWHFRPRNCQAQDLAFSLGRRSAHLAINANCGRASCQVQQLARTITYVLGQGHKGPVPYTHRLCLNFPLTRARATGPSSPDRRAPRRADRETSAAAI